MLEEYFLNYQKQIAFTVVTLITVAVIQVLLKKTAQRVGRKSEIQVTRTRLMFKYINILVILIAVFLLLLSWGYELRDLSLLFSSVFAVLGVALFAIWSILSNVTAGVILF